jgi:RimJ/RimL family protein N-acetyltransferase
VSAAGTVLLTERLRLRLFSEADAAFVLDLFTQPSFIAGVADRGLRTEADAARYVRERLAPAYAEHGFGFWAVERRADGETIGLCGLIRRDALDDVDVGYALLPQHTGQGYAREAVAATLTHARDALGLDRVVAIVNPDNTASVRLLRTLGLRLESALTMPGEDAPVHLFGIALRPPR